MNFVNYMTYQSTLKTSHILSLTDEKVRPAVPRFMLCSYQGHSRHKIKALYPEVNSTMITHLYSANITGSTNYEHINLTKFAWDTKPDIGKVLETLTMNFYNSTENPMRTLKSTSRMSHGNT